MKCCEDHLNQIRSAIKARGYGHLCEERSPEGYKPMVNPLVDVQMMIFRAYSQCAIEVYGMAFVDRVNSGLEICPVCDVLSHGGESDHWIDEPVEAWIKRYAERGSGLLQ